MLAHIWPTHHENVHFYGTHSVDVDGELAKLDSDGYRPLRAAGEDRYPIPLTGQGSASVRCQAGLGGRGPRPALGPARRRGRRLALG